MKPKLTRGDFFRDCIGRLITAAVIVAESANNDKAINRLLRAKDKLNRRRGK